MSPVLPALYALSYGHVCQAFFHSLCRPWRRQRYVQQARAARAAQKSAALALLRARVKRCCYSVSLSRTRSHGGAVDEPVLCQVSRLLPSRCEVQAPPGLDSDRPCSLAKHALKAEAEVSLGLAVCSGSAPHVRCQVDPSQDEVLIAAAVLVSCSSLLPVFGLMSSVLELAS